MGFHPSLHATFYPYLLQKTGQVDIGYDPTIRGALDHLHLCPWRRWKRRTHQNLLRNDQQLASGKIIQLQNALQFGSGNLAFWIHTSSLRLFYKTSESNFNQTYGTWFSFNFVPSKTIQEPCISQDLKSCSHRMRFGGLWFPTSRW